MINRTLRLYAAEFHGHYLGGIAIIAAGSEDEAMQLLVAELKEHGLDGRRAKILREINTSQPKCFVLWDGDY